MDALYHSDWAKDILAGGTWAADDVYFRGPLYPYLLAGLYKISGDSITFAVFVQHVLGTLSAGLTFLLAREYFSPRVSLVAGIIAALYWPLVYFEGDLLIVTTIVFLNAIMFLLFAKAAKSQKLWMYAAAGFVLGLSAVARPSILIFFPVVPVFIYLTARRAKGGHGATPSWVRQLVFTAVAAAIVITPVMVRNWVVGHAIVPVAASGGVNFYIGNNPRSDGSTAIVPNTRADWWGGFEDAIAIAERDEGRKLGLAGVSDYYFKRGLNFITSRPGDAAALMFKKTRLFWAGPERANNKFIYFFWHLAGMKYIPLPAFWIVAPFGLLGAFLLWPRRRELSMLYLFVVTYSIGVILFFVNARFRLPVVPILIIFAAYGALYIVAAFRSRSFGVAPALLVLTIAAVAVNHDYLWVRQMRSYSSAISHYTLGNAYLKMGLGETALENFQTAVRINREEPTPAFKLIARDVYYNLGVLLWDRGLCSRAIDALSKVDGTDVYAQTAMDHLGDCYLKRNQVQQAGNVYKRFLTIAPNDPRAITGMARCYAMTGDLERARSMLEPIVNPTQSVYPPAYMALGEVQFAMGDIDQAIESFTDVSRYPGYEREALMRLAEMYRQKGDIDAAIATLETARNYFPPTDTTVPNMINALRSQR
jgi:tetratricopeptide (TPR) repeat protein